MLQAVVDKLQVRLRERLSCVLLQVTSRKREQPMAKPIEAALMVDAQQPRGMPTGIATIDLPSDVLKTSGDAAELPAAIDLICLAQCYGVRGFLAFHRVKREVRRNCAPPDGEIAAVTLTTRVTMLLWLRGGGGGAESSTLNLSNITLRLEKATNRLGLSLGLAAAPQPTGLPDVTRLMHAVNTLSSVVEQLEKRKGEDEEAMASAAVTKATTLQAAGEEAWEKAAAEQALAEQVVSREQAAEMAVQASGEKEEAQVTSVAEQVVNAQSAGDVVVHKEAAHDAAAQAAEQEAAKWPRLESICGLEPHDFSQLLGEKYGSWGI